MGQGENVGTITERKGKFQAKIRLKGVNLSETFATRKEADDFIKINEGKITAGQSVDIHKARKLYLRDIFDEYIADGKISTRKKQTITIIKNELFNVKLEDITTRSLTKYIEIKSNQKVKSQSKKKKTHRLYDGDTERLNKSSTVRKYYFALKTALQWHAKINSYDFNRKPFEEVTPPKAWEKPRERRLEDGELDRLLLACEKMYKNKEQLKQLILFQMYSAMRIGETLQMKWKDVHIDEVEKHNSYIFISKYNQKTKNKGAEDRYVLMREDLYNLVVKMRQERFLSKEDRVFPYWKSSTTIGQRFKNICKNATVKDFTLHDFRHEAIAWFFENTNLTDIEISKITGHIEMDTLKRYATLRPKKIGAKLWNVVL